jgi:hypothetical protein
MNQATNNRFDQMNQSINDRFDAMHRMMMRGFFALGGITVTCLALLSRFGS